MARIVSIATLAGALTTGLIAIAQFAGSPARVPAATAAPAPTPTPTPPRMAARQIHAVVPARQPRDPHTSVSDDTSRVLRVPGRAARGSGHAPAVTAAAACRPTHTVRPGETLSSIAARCYGSPGDWPALYGANTAAIANPNMIYPGQVLSVPARPAHVTAYVDADADADAATTSTAAAPARQQPTATSTARGTPVTASYSGADGGTYGCGSLEALWEHAGGNPADAHLAAEIAMAESGGNPGAISPTDDYGLWQINASNGALATLSPQANARSAVIISRDGTDWSPWTTYRTGAYWGRC